MKKILLLLLSLGILSCSNENENGNENENIIHFGREYSQYVNITSPASSRLYGIIPLKNSIIVYQYNESYDSSGIFQNVSNKVEKTYNFATTVTGDKIQGNGILLEFIDNGCFIRAFEPLPQIVDKFFVNIVN